MKRVRALTDIYVCLCVCGCTYIVIYSCIYDISNSGDSSSLRLHVRLYHSLCSPPPPLIFYTYLISQGRRGAQLSLETLPALAQLLPDASAETLVRILPLL